MAVLGKASHGACSLLHAATLGYGASMALTWHHGSLARQTQQAHGRGR